jgi:asparagine N-glycosylation enzyme membrane subunit Stt3
MARGKSSVAVFLTAFLLRLLQPFSGPITPLDELYHLKRIEYTAAHFPRVLDLDPDRGVHGAFCPWPPLYDLILGGIARLFGVRAVFWVPPIGFALFAALATWWIARRFGSAAAWATGAVLAASPFLVQISARGDIDHHWLEPPLVFAMLAAVCAAVDKNDVRHDLRAGILLGIAITCAMFVQTALLVAAGLSFVVLFLLTDGIAGATAFSIAAAAVALYRLTRPPGYPDSAWFLGWTHAALFAAAAVACALPNLAQGHVTPALSRRVRPRLFALLTASAVVLACPTAPSSLLAGSHFFGGERWLQTIVEFQPLWKGHLDDYLSIGTGLGIGALLVWPLLFARGRRQHFAVALFAAVYLVLTLTSRRFWTVAIPLLALAGAIYATHVAPALSRRFSKLLPTFLLLAIALPPPIQLALWMRQPSYPIAPPLQPWVRTAQRLRALPPGRVLAAWSYGHMLDVIGRHPVIVDNFGTMPDEGAFERAYDALLQNDEEALVRWCHAAGVRYVVLEYPAAGMHSAVAVLGVEATKRPRGTWWWRVWFAPGSRHFRLVSSEPTVMLLELRDDVR